MNKSKLLVLLLLMAGCASWASAQSDNINSKRSFTLHEAQKYAVENSYETTIANLEIEKAKKQVGETRAMGLPQINGEVEYQNFLNLATQLIPAQIFDPTAPVGSFAEVQFGTKHNATIGVTATQLLFSGSYIVALRASKAYMNMTEIQSKRTVAQVRQNVHQAYVAVLVSKESLVVLDSLYVATQKNLHEIKAMNEAGFKEETDVDQVDLLLSGIETQRINAKNQLAVAESMLKYNIGISMKEEITLTNTLAEVMKDFDMESYLAAELAVESNVDYQAAKNQVRIMDLQLDLERSAILPTLSAFFSQQWAANRNEFNFGDSDEKWFPTSLVGIKLSIPIFAGGERYYKTQKAKVDYKIAETKLIQISDGLRLEFATAKSTYNNQYLVYKNSKKDKTVAKRIYDRTLIKYTKGVASSFELLQTHNQYLQKETAYFMALQNFMNSKAALDRLLAKFEEL